MNQPAGLVNPADTLYPVRVMIFITLLSIGYELSQPLPTKKTEPELLLPATASESSSGEYDWGSLPSWQKKASEKAVERYAATQEKKWQRWNEAMFERIS